MTTASFSSWWIFRSSDSAEERGGGYRRSTTEPIHVPEHLPEHPPEQGPEHVGERSERRPVPPVGGIPQAELLARLSEGMSRPPERRWKWFISRCSSVFGVPVPDGSALAHLEGPDETLSAVELERSFLQILTLVPDRARQALVLRSRDGWTYEEVGDALGISKVAARALILRYQERLHPFLERLRLELQG